MEKNHQQWHCQKHEIDLFRLRPHFHERQIWFCRVGANVGYEQDGSGELFLRPVIVLKKFNSDTFWAIPLTTTLKEPGIHYYLFSFRASVTSVALLSQLRLLDAKRLQYRTGSITESDFLILKRKIRQLLA